MKKIKKKRLLSYVFFMMLLLLIIGASGVEVFEYSEFDSRITVISKMNSSINSYSDYNTARFEHIMEEAGTSSDYIKLASMFQNLSILFEEVVDESEKIENELEYLDSLDYEIEDEIYTRLNSAEEYIYEGKYESAEPVLHEVSSYVESFSAEFFNNTRAEYEIVKEKYDSLDISTSVLTSFNIELSRAEDNNDLILLDRLDSDLSEILYSVDALVNIRQYIDYFEEKEIQSTRLSDIEDEMLFNFKRDKQERVKELFESAELLYSQAVEYDNIYVSVNTNLDELKSKTGEEYTEIYTELGESYEYYKKAEFEKALLIIAKANEDVLDIKSRIFFKTGDSLPVLVLIKQNYKIILIVLAALFMISVIFSKQLKYSMRKKREKNLEKEKRSLVELIKKAQTEYYDNKNISKKVYEQKNSSYQKKLVKVTKELALLKNETKIK